MISINNYKIVFTDCIYILTIDHKRKEIKAPLNFINKDIQALIKNKQYKEV